MASFPKGTVTDETTGRTIPSDAQRHYETLARRCDVHGRHVIDETGQRWAVVVSAVLVPLPTT